MTDEYSPEESNSDAGTGIVQSEWDGDLQPSMATVETVAAAVGHSPTELEPLHDSIDPEALDAIVAPDSESTDAVYVSFTYEGLDVVVDSQNGIEIRPNDGDRKSSGDSTSE